MTYVIVGVLSFAVGSSFGLVVMSMLWAAGRDSLLDQLERLEAAGDDLARESGAYAAQRVRTGVPLRVALDEWERAREWALRAVRTAGTAA